MKKKKNYQFTLKEAAACRFIEENLNRKSYYLGRQINQKV